MRFAGFVVDADGHVMEPSDLWLRYVAPPFRDRAIQIRRDEADGDKLVVDGRVSTTIPRLGGVPANPDGTSVNWNYLDGLSHYTSYDESCVPASYEPRARLEWMDRQGIDVSVLFPSLSLIWPREVDADGAYVRAHMLAYNRWIAEFASADRDRLVPVAQLAMYGLEEVLTDLAGVRELGIQHVMLPRVPEGSGSPFSREYDRFWQRAEELDVVVHLHKAAIPHLLAVPPGRPLAGPGTGRFFTHVHETLAAQLCLAALFDSGLPDRVPKLRFSFLECNAGWLPAWLDRADESYEVLAGHGHAPLANPPRFYIEEQDRFFFSLGMAEDPVPLVKYASRLVIATDYPHPDAPLETMAAWIERLEGRLSGEVVCDLMGRNARRMLRSDFGGGRMEEASAAATSRIER